MVLRASLLTVAIFLAPASMVDRQLGAAPGVDPV
jgi:hypothetical protein